MKKLFAILLLGSAFSLCSASPPEVVPDDTKNVVSLQVALDYSVSDIAIEPVALTAYQHQSEVRSAFDAFDFNTAWMPSEATEQLCWFSVRVSTYRHPESKLLPRGYEINLPPPNIIRSERC